jgi:hypothetical protein
MFAIEWSLAMAFGLTAAALQAVGFALMTFAILRGSARPNQCSWLIWSIVATLAALSSWQAGTTWPLAGASFNALGCTLVLVLALRCGYFRCDWVDATCFFLAVAGLGGWLVTDQPVVGLALFLAADACGAVPTFRNILIDPSRESTAGWAVLTAAGVAAVLSVDHGQWVLSWTGFGQWGAAVYVATINLLLMSGILLAQLMRSRTPTRLGDPVAGTAVAD